MSFFDGKLNIEVAAASGIEAVVKRELVKLGYEPQGAQFGRIPFVGRFVDVARANMFLRTGERVRIILASFPATTFDELFDGVRGIDWKEIVGPDAKIIVNAKSRNSRLFALSSVQSVCKKAIMLSIAESFHIFRPKESGSVYSIEISIYNDVATVKLDTSGEPLHKRGYRTYLGDAPIRETLASAMIELSVWNPDRALIDPFCGSGTIPIEAAMIGLKIASGLQRTFAYEGFEGAPRVRDIVQQEAEDMIVRNKKLNISGFDIDPEAIRLAFRHASAAGVRDSVHLQVEDMRKVSSRYSHGVIIANPPYGERLLDEAELKTLYGDFGKMTASLDEWCVYVITSFKAFEKYYGKRADRTRKLFNGELECTYYQYLASPPDKK